MAAQLGKHYSFISYTAYDGLETHAYQTCVIVIIVLAGYSTSTQLVFPLTHSES